MKNIKKIYFNHILEGSFIFFTDNFIYNFVLSEEKFSKHVFLSFSSKLGKSNKRNYIKRILRNIWFEITKKNNMVVIIRFVKTDKKHFSNLKFHLLLEEYEKIKEFLFFIFQEEYSYMLKLN